MATTGRLRLLILILVIFCIHANGLATQLSCYTCRGTLGGFDPDNCALPNTNTTSKLCDTSDVFCKKRLVRAAGVTTIERRCYDVMCTDQQGIAMGQGIDIDTYCCTGVLCNLSARPQPLLATIVTGIFVIGPLLLNWIQHNTMS